MTLPPERSGFGVAGRRHGPDDLLCIAVDQVVRRHVLLRVVLATFPDGDVRPGLVVAVDVALNRVPVRVVHAPVVLFVSGDPHRMDCAAYPAIRFPARGVVGLLNGASANNPTCKETRNLDGPDNVGFNPDGKPGLPSTSAIPPRCPLSSSVQTSSCSRETASPGPPP